MRPFSSVAIPHRDVLEGRLTEDVFAADLWGVFQGRGPEDYRDKDTFFRKTYLTDGLRNLLEAAERRLMGEGGDSVIQLQTPFGGGKTHSLIALYHKARDWGVKVVVIDGTALDPREQTIWGEMERQLRGEVRKFGDKVPPGSDKLRALLEEDQPVLILMDEVLQYTTKAAGVKVGDSNLAAQVLAFMHELTKAVSSVSRCLLVLTLPSSLLERYDEHAERLSQQLQKITGRMEKVYSPVKDEEIASVIRKRLFSSIDDEEAASIVEDFLDYAEREGFLPSDKRSEYRRRFLSSYPFQPEVIDVLYTKWGSFPTFQRTRGVLRLLSLVVYSLKESGRPFIRLGDFNLAEDAIRRELVKHIGSQYDSVIASDITGSDSGAKKVDEELGRAYEPYRFGTKVATAIFMSSFSGGPERGVTLAELKLACSEIGVPSSIVIEALNKLKEKLFFLQSDGRLFFSDQPNLNRILLTKMENVTEKELIDEERNLISGMVSKEHFEVYIWPESSKDVPDTRKLKLLILKNFEEGFCKELIGNCGEGMRVHGNTLIFLCPSERTSLTDFLRRKIAWESIERDETLSLTEQQRKEVREKVGESRRDSRRKVREAYRIVYLPSREGLKRIELGIPALGVRASLSEEVYDRLKSEGLLVDRMLDPRLLRDKYLRDKDYVNLRALIDSFYKTPGELILASEDVIREAVRKGVSEGIFGYGFLDGDKPVCERFKEDFKPEISDNSILIRPELCKVEEAVEEVVSVSKPSVMVEVKPSPVREVEVVEPKEYSSIRLILKVPFGRLSDVVRLLPYLGQKFEDVEVKVDIRASKGKISHNDYLMRVKEIEQSGIGIEAEELE
ncbi:MAG: DUF499 domain-containing protein [Candidatus Korarchaeum sp.]